MITEPQACGKHQAMLAKADQPEEVDVEPTDVEASETVEALEESFLFRPPDFTSSSACFTLSRVLAASHPGSPRGRASSRSHTMRIHLARTSLSEDSVMGRFILIHPLWSLALLCSLSFAETNP